MSGYDIGFITYAKYMRNKEFSSEKTAKSWLTVHQPKEFLLTFHNFPVAFFLLLFTAKTWKFSRICLQVLHIFKGELYGMSIIVSKKKGWMTQGFSWIFPWSSNSESTELLCTARRFYADFFALASDAFLSQGIIINILLYCRVGP